jgi:hypothetical protein
MTTMIVRRALPFERPKLGAITYSNVDAAAFAATLDRAMERNGKAEEVKLIEGRINEPKE